MKRTQAITLSVIATGALLVALPTYAQVAIAPYGGVLIFDDGAVESAVEFDPGPLLGARVAVGDPHGWQIEGGYGFAPLTVESSDGAEDDVDVHLFYGGVNYLVGRRDVTNLLLSAGIGVMALTNEDLDTGTDPMISIAAGFTHPVGDRVDLRGEVRDHIVFCSSDGLDALGDLEEASACFFDDETLNHIEISGGVEFWF